MSEAYSRYKTRCAGCGELYDIHSRHDGSCPVFEQCDGRRWLVGYGVTGKFCDPAREEQP